jgi:hypothetical protein
MSSAAARAMAFEEAFRLAFAGPGGGSAGRSRDIVRLLIEAAVDVPREPAIREPSLFEDGTPVGFSLQLGSGSPASFRLLVEPGGLAIGLAEQIDRSLGTLGSILTTLGWSESARDLNHFAQGVYPANPAELAGWWGGMWLGVAAGTEFDLRVYMNLRSGPLISRWQRIVDVLTYRADDSFEPDFRAFIDQSIDATAVPVGLGLVLAQDKLRGVRIYQGLERADPISVSRSIPEALREAAEAAIMAPVRALFDEMGQQGAQAITMAHDFAVKGRTLQSRVTRVKCDVNCRGYVAEDADRFEGWLLSTIEERDRDHVARFSKLLTEHFGGAQLDYFSLACAVGNRRQRTLYVQPSGLCLPRC